MQLDGKVAIITGAGSGIGASIARHFVGAGAQIVITGRSAEKLDAARELTGVSERVRTFVMDVADRGQVHELIEQTMRDYGRIDMLVNNAGVNIAERSLPQLAAEDWDELLAINATGAFNMIQAVLPVMRAQRDGLIISISSISGIRPSALGGAAYSAAKHAMTALTRVVGLEEAANGIRATTISPGEVDTPLLTRRPTPVSAERRAQILQPDDVAAAALFVASLPPRACVPELVITPTVIPFA
jgi:NADP-dependent 3-hydroxy acid dehydrogenase YdfG